MKTSRWSPAAILALTLAFVAAAPLAAQSFNRIRRSVDRATGGQTAAPVRPVTTPAAPTLTPEQAAAVKAAELKRQKASAAAAEDKVVPFLRERVEGGSADAAFDLAQRYEEGRGVKADPEEARRLYTLGAERGNDEAKKWLQEHPEPPAAAGTAAGGKPKPASPPSEKKAETK